MTVVIDNFIQQNSILVGRRLSIEGRRACEFNCGIFQGYGIKIKIKLMAIVTNLVVMPSAGLQK